MSDEELQELYTDKDISSLRWDEFSYNNPKLNHLMQYERDRLKYLYNKDRARVDLIWWEEMPTRLRNRRLANGW